MQWTSKGHKRDAAFSTLPPVLARKRVLVLTVAGASLFWLFFWGSTPSAVQQQQQSPWQPPSTPPKLYFVITASLRTNEGEKNALKRKEQYIRGISSLVTAVTQQPLPLDYHIVVVENNGPRQTFLDELEHVTVLYTNNNKRRQKTTDSNWWWWQSSEPSKGTKELWDVLACIDHFAMQPHDLVVKMTGRYYLDTQAPGKFFQALYHLNWQETQAIVKFGSYMRPVDTPNIVDCITGLILLPVHAIRRIQPREIIEHAWAQEALDLPANSVLPVQGKMGIYIAPGGVQYYVV